MHNRTRLSWPFLACTLLCLESLSACETKQDNQAPPPPTNPPSAAPASALAPSAEQKNPAPEPKASASSEAAQEAPNGLVGTWEGTFEAKKGSVEMPPKVKDKVRDKDDGKTATGKGTISITISKDNDLKGKTEGALGTATLSGKTEGDDIRATFFPDDATAKQAMFGILTGKLEANHIKGWIRVANGNASIVREAQVDLQKK